MAECLMERIGGPRFRGFSAGSFRPVPSIPARWRSWNGAITASTTFARRTGPSSPYPAHRRWISCSRCATGRGARSARCGRDSRSPRTGGSPTPPRSRGRRPWSAPRSRRPTGRSPRDRDLHESAVRVARPHGAETKARRDRARRVLPPLGCLERSGSSKSSQVSKVVSRVKVRGCEGYEGPARLAPGRVAQHACRSAQPRQPRRYRPALPAIRALCAAAGSRCRAGSRCG